MSDKHDAYPKVRLHPDVAKEAKRRIHSMPYRPSFTSFINTTLTMAFGMGMKSDNHKSFGRAASLRSKV